MPAADVSSVLVRPCPEPKFGDYQTNALMGLAKRNQLRLHICIIISSNSNRLQRLALVSRHSIAYKQIKTVRLGAEIDETNIAHIESAT